MDKKYVSFILQPPLPLALIQRSFVKIIHKKSTHKKVHSRSEEPQCSRHVLAEVLRLILNQSGFIFYHYIIGTLL